VWWCGGSRISRIWRQASAQEDERWGVGFGRFRILCQQQLSNNKTDVDVDWFIDFDYTMFFNT